MQQKHQDDSLQTCAICQEVVLPGNQAYLDSCKHVYCARCILHWLDKNKECPLCKQRVEKVFSLDKNGQQIITSVSLFERILDEIQNQWVYHAKHYNSLSTIDRKKVECLASMKYLRPTYFTRKYMPKKRLHRNDTQVHLRVEMRFLQTQRKVRQILEKKEFKPIVWRHEIESETTKADL